MNKRTLGASVAMVLLAAACGQYPRTHELQIGYGPAGQGVAPGTAGAQGSGLGGGTTTGTGGTVPGALGGTSTTTGAPGTSTTTGGTAGGTIPGSTPSTGATTPPPGGGGSTPTPGQTTPPPGGGGTPTPPPGGGNMTGVTATNITIGIHAPITGAAPVTNESFVTQKDLYWRYGGPNLTPVNIYGRGVTVLIKDDQYTPSTATAVCQQMAEGQGSADRNAFLLIGGAGTDQIVACAQYARARGIPYLSAGVAQTNLQGFANYFALSMTYSQQMPLLAQYIHNVMGKTNNSRILLVASDTANFNDAVAAFQRYFPGAPVLRPPKNDHGEQWGDRLCSGVTPAYDVVVPITAPTFYLEMAGRAAGCHPQFAGVGITMGVDEVADVGCKAGTATQNAQFFHPTPAFIDSDQYDANFRKAAAKANVEADDIGWILWGLSKALHQMLIKAGQNLTREGFINAVQTGTFNPAPFPALRYSPTNHFGASSVNVLINMCNGVTGGFYDTLHSNKTGF